MFVLLKEGQERYEFKTAHGFRKFFKTQAEQYVKAANVEMLMRHDLGISKSYYKPQEKEVMDDYLKAVKNLRVQRNDNIQLEKEIDETAIKNSFKSICLWVVLELIYKERIIRNIDHKLLGKKTTI
jgi:hypothetical protein